MTHQEFKTEALKFYICDPEIMTYSEILQEIESKASTNEELSEDIRIVQECEDYNLNTLLESIEAQAKEYERMYNLGKQSK